MYKIVQCIFMLALTISEILTFKMFDLKKVCHGHRVQLSQWSHSMAKIKINKRDCLHFLFSPRYEVCTRK